MLSYGLALLLATAPQGDPASPAAAPGAAAPEAAPEAQTAPERGQSDVPPPSAYDRQLQSGVPDRDVMHGGQHGREGLDDERSLTYTLMRTVLALAAVLALIYLFAKVGLPRLVQGVSSFKTGSRIKVVERTQLDARHGLYLVELDGTERLLLGTGEQGVQVLMRSTSAGAASGPSFQEHLGGQPAATQSGKGESNNDATSSS